MPNWAKTLAHALSLASNLTRSLLAPRFLLVLPQIFHILVVFWCLAAGQVMAKPAKKAHPVKKVDVRPNPSDNDIWSFSLESDIYETTTYLSPTVDFSAKDGWDMQLAFYNIPVHGGGAQNYEWDSYFNLSKTFGLNSYFKSVIGSQNGTTLFSNNRHWHNFDYALIVYQPVAFLNLHAGPYWANKALTTITNTLGYTTGFNLELVKDKLSIQGDYYSGHSNVSGAVVNLFYQWRPKFQVYIGAGVPEENSGNEFYGTVGVNWSSQ